MKRSKENALLVLYAGEKMYRIAMPFVFILFGALALLGIICLVFVMIGDGQYLPRYFALNGFYPFLTAIFGILMSLIGLGLLALPFFLFGLLLLGVGQIALNTLREDKNQEPWDGTTYEPYREDMFGMDISSFGTAPQPAPMDDPAPQAAPAPIPVTPQPVYVAPQPAPMAPPAPQPQPAPQQQATTPTMAKPKFAPAFVNNLRLAVESKSDDEMFAILEKAAARSHAPHEKQLIRQIMNRSTGKIRPMVNEVYAALTRENQ